MGIVAINGADYKMNYPMEIDRKEKCFYCYKRLTSPYVVWIGNEFELKIHPECVIELHIRMLRDVLEIENVTGKAVTGGRYL